MVYRFCESPLGLFSEVLQHRQSRDGLLPVYLSISRFWRPEGLLLSFTSLLEKKSFILVTFPTAAPYMWYEIQNDPHAEL